MTDQVLQVPAIPEQSETDFVNLGLHNWRALRADWNKKPENWKPKARKKVNTERIFEEIANQGTLSERVPLPDFIRILSDVWEAEGVI